MLKVMVMVSSGWIRLGLPLQVFKIVVYSKNPQKLSESDTDLISIFQDLKASLEKAPMIVKVVWQT